MGKYCNENNKQMVTNQLINAVELVFGNIYDSSINNDLKYAFSKAMVDAGIFDNRNLIDAKDYIACKLWSKDDIKCELAEKGYDDSEENVQAVIDSGLLSGLNDCYDQDWSIIEYAITETLGRPAEREDF